MALATVCTVSGLVQDAGGNPLQGVVVTASVTKPYLHPVSLAIVPNYQVSDTTDNIGAWALDLIETTTPNLSVTITFVYPLGPVSGQGRYEYTIIVPNAATANFSDLIAGET